MERLAHAPLTRSGFTSFFALQLFEVAVTADFLNNPQWNSGVAHRSLAGRCDGSCGWRLPRCRPARTLVSKSDPLSWGAGVSSGGSGGDRGISKSGGRGNALMSRDFANLQSLESSCFEVFLWCWQGASVNCRTDSARVCVDIFEH